MEMNIEESSMSTLEQMRLRSNVRVSTWKDSPDDKGASAANAPPPTRRRRQHFDIIEWVKKLLLCIAILVAFSFMGKERPNKSKETELENLERCDLNSYPLWRLPQLKELDLSSCDDNLNLPDDSSIWSNLSSLTKLDLNNNQLTSLPSSMQSMPSLEILFLSENKFEVIPALIGKLQKLRVLSLRGNVITDLSSANLPTATLEWLILTNNRIQTIDANIKDLTFLKKLMLSHNNISVLPSELGDCHNLELVRLADNNIQTVPDSVLTLSKLAWISLSGNPFSINTSTKEPKVIIESELEIDETDILGSGASGKVYKGKYKGEDVAVKIFKAMAKGSDGNSEDEAKINSLIETPHAISAIGVIPAPKLDRNYQGMKYKGMVMKLLSGTYPMGTVPNFRTVTRDEGPAPHATNLSFQEVLGAIWNIASALEYIHSSVGVCHGDVYLHNILRDGKGVARLSDWGASFSYDRGTELASKIESIEVLAFGRLIQDLINWNLNTAAPGSTELGLFVGRAPFKDLLASILHPETSRRPTFAEIKKQLTSIPNFSSVQLQ